MIIAIDGPAAAGKGTLARRLAAHFRCAYLDTGLLYRAVGAAVLRAGKDPGHDEAAATAAAALVPADLEDPGLRSEAAGQAASKVAAHPKVRAALLAFQRDFAANPPGGAAGAVVDGRDIGTVVLPDADFKLFVFASEEERARRRWAELAAAGDAPDPDEVLAALRARDRRDAERAVSPLTPAPGCYLLDTTDLDIDAAFAAAKAYISGPI